MLERKEAENNVYEISKAFAIRIVNLYKYLKEEKSELIMSKQLFRSGTSIGANVFEGKNAQSRADFTNKMNIALKEADETDYWLRLLWKSEVIDEEQYNSLSKDIKQIIGTLVKIIKNSRPS